MKSHATIHLPRHPLANIPQHSHLPITKLETILGIFASGHFLSIRNDKRENHLQICYYQEAISYY